MRKLPLLLLFLLAGTASAAELRSIKVDYDRGEYSLVSEIWLDASLEATYQVYSRWDYSTQFSSAIVEARDLEPDDRGRPGFYVRNKGCVLFFCKSLVRQGYVEREDNRVLRAFANPETSDFEFSNEVWTFAEDKGGTRVLYELHMDPKFWIPPAIGPYMIKRKLKKDGGDAIDRMEEIAQGFGNADENAVD